MKRSYSRLFPAALLGCLAACSLAVTRPIQEMTNTAAAIRAAREVQADTRAPELYRQANEWFFRARQEYKLKNFKEARVYSSKARRFAEEAEYEALASGANRISAPPDPLGNVGAVEPPRTKEPKVSKKPVVEGAPEEKPAENGISVDSYEEQEAYRKKLELQKAANPPPPAQQITIQNQTPGTLPLPTPRPTR